MHVQFIPRLDPHHLRYFRIYYQALLIDSHHSPVYIIAIYLYRTIHVMPFPPRHLRQPQINHQYNIIPQQITPCIPSLFHIARHPYIVITRRRYLCSSHMAIIMIYYNVHHLYTQNHHYSLHTLSYMYTSASAGLPSIMASQVLLCDPSPISPYIIITTRSHNDNI